MLIVLLLLLLLLISIFLIPSGEKIPRVKNKVKSKTKSWSGHSSSLEKLLWSKMELKRWIVIDMRWKRKLSSRLSPEVDAILRPSSEKKAIDDSFNEPSVSAAIGWNRLSTGRLFSCCTTWASPLATRIIRPNRMNRTRAPRPVRRLNYWVRTAPEFSFQQLKTASMDGRTWSFCRRLIVWLECERYRVRR